MNLAYVPEGSRLKPRIAIVPFYGSLALDLAAASAQTGFAILIPAKRILAGFPTNKNQLEESESHVFN
jgi:hypothetical protein